MSMENTTVNDHFSRLDRLIKEYQQSEYTDISYLSPDEQKAEHTRQQQVCKNARKECRDLIRELNINGITRSRKKVIKSRIRDEIKTFFLTQKLDNSASGRKSTLKSLNSIISRYVSADGILGMNSLRRICFPSVSSSEYLLRCITDQMDPQEEAIIKKLKKVQQIMKINTNELLRQELGGNRYADSFFRSVREKFTFDVISDLVSRNPYYRKYFRNLREIEIRSARITQGLLDAIPDTYPDLFPLARQMQRHFILHIGPTNSGKSHDALIALKEAATGVYLAPLRLLAYEKYEELIDYIDSECKDFGQYRDDFITNVKLI